jgi:hypothetical protein
LKKHRLEGISNAVMTNDGRFAMLELVTDTAPPFPLEIPTDDLDRLIAQLLAVALQAGKVQGIDPDGLPTTGPRPSVPIPANGAGVSMGRPGHSMLIVRVGCLDLSMEIENSRVKTLGTELLSLGTRLESEPRKMQ